MPKLVINGKFTPKGGAAIDNPVLEGDCQTCGAEFNIAIPYDLGAAKSNPQLTVSTSIDAHTGKRTINVG